MEKFQLYKITKEIQEKSNIVEVIGNFIKIKKLGANFVGVCPFHNDTKPSLTISPKKKIWKCFVCGVGGDVVQFVKLYKKCTTIEAVKIIGEMINFDFTNHQDIFNNTQFDEKTKHLYDSIKASNDFYVASLFDKTNLNVLQYLKKRGIDEEIIKYFKIGYAPNTNILNKILTNKNDMFGRDYNKNLIWNISQLSDASLINISEDGSVHDFFIDRITFPIFNSDGAIVAFSGRTTSNKEPKYLNSKENSIFSKSKILYNFQNIISQDVDTLIIVEGFMDAIAYHRAGIKNVVATMGTVLTPEHISLIKSLPNIRSVVLSFDNDAAGTNATIINGLKLLEQKIHTFVVGPYDKKYKDVDELLLHNSSEALHQIINNQEDYILFLINTLFSATQHTLANRLNIVEKIIKIMVDNDDVLLKSMHIDALAEFSKLSVKDIEQQYSIILKKKYKEYDYSNDERKNLEECLVENDVPNEEIKDEISVLNYKLNLIGNIISSLLSQLIYFSIKDHKVIDLYDKKIYFNELSSHFPLECKLLKILLIFEHTDNVNENEIINYFRQNDEKNVINVEYYLENLKKIFDFEIKDINNRVVDELINTINIRKIEFINTILSMQIFKEETKPNKDKKTIDELWQEIRENNLKKKDYQTK